MTVGFLPDTLKSSSEAYWRPFGTLMGTALKSAGISMGTSLVSFGMSMSSSLVSDGTTMSDTLASVWMLVIKALVYPEISMNSSSTANLVVRQDVSERYLDVQLDVGDRCVGVYPDVNELLLGTASLDVRQDFGERHLDVRLDVNDRHVGVR